MYTYIHTSHFYIVITSYRMSKCFHALNRLRRYAVPRTLNSFNRTNNSINDETDTNVKLDDTLSIKECNGFGFVTQI